MVKKILGMEHGSVRFHRIKRTQFWLTPSNRVFIVTPESEIIFPKIQGGIIHYDDRLYVPPPGVGEWLLVTLQKQAEIRFKWQQDEEDDDAQYTYS